MKRVIAIIVTGFAGMVLMTAGAFVTFPIEIISFGIRGSAAAVLVLGCVGFTCSHLLRTLDSALFGGVIASGRDESLVRFAALAPWILVGMFGLMHVVAEMRSPGAGGDFVQTYRFEIFYVVGSLALVAGLWERPLKARLGKPSP